MLLANKVALLSGVGPGLGVDTARVFAREGAALSLFARSEDRLRAVADELTATGTSVIWSAGDLCDAGSVTAAVERTVAAFGRIDALVNLAFVESSWQGVQDVEADLTPWRRAFDVHVFGTMRMTREVARQMVAQGGGSIVMVGSIAAAGTMPQIADYTGSKAALAAMARTLAHELGPSGVRVNTVHPGTMWGPYNEARLGKRAEANGTTVEVEVQRVADSTPLRYVPAGAEVAEVLAFFASDRARPVTGQQLHVNVGQYMH